MTGISRRNCAAYKFRTLRTLRQLLARTLPTKAGFRNYLPLAQLLVLFSTSASTRLMSVAFRAAPMLVEIEWLVTDAARSRPRAERRLNQPNR